MKYRLLLLATLIAATTGAGAIATRLLPSNWTISAPAGAMSVIGTMPQGIAFSPNHRELAVVEAGVEPPALRILSVPSLQTRALIHLRDAFGVPIWRDDHTVVIAAASANGAFSVDTQTQTVTHEKGAQWATAVALSSGAIVTTSDTKNSLVADDGTTFPVGSHPGAVARAGKSFYVANRGESTVTLLDSLTAGAHSMNIPVDLHPSALLASSDGSKLYVACADADTVDVIDTKRHAVVSRVAIGLPYGPGASPNGLALASDGTLYVSLGAENAVAAIRNGHVVARSPAGWYPTGVAVDANNVYVTNGKGEGSHGNPAFSIDRVHEDPQYVGHRVLGSVRSIPRSDFNAATTARVLANMPSAVARPATTVVRAGGPIRHVIYIIKENRTYDQVLGDIKGANGDPRLAMFGERVTPNQHAIARRFGVFDATFADAQVSANGHNWSTAAFANDYLEHFWPSNYGQRRKLYDFEDGAVASTPRNGYLWDQVHRQHVSFRDYGEFVTYAPLGGGFVTTSMPGLQGKIDTRFPPFDLLVSDDRRVNEWQREFNLYVTNGNLPSLEIVRLPNDHTAGTRRLLPTPAAFVAQNDHALGRIVDIVSHSKYWASTAIFAIEDDAQNGPDHVDEQRTTLYLASPYAAPGVHHARYSTSSVLHTIELILGLHPLSIYDSVAPPLYDAFTTHANLAPFSVIAPNISLVAVNKANAYGSALSQRIDLRHADTFDPATLNDILAHAGGSQ